MIVKDAAKLKQEAEQIIREERAEWQRQQVEAQKQRDAETLSPDAGRDRTSLEAQIGRPLTRSEIVRKLQSLIPDMYYEQSKALPTRGGLYIKGKFLVGMEHDISPEFSLMDPTEQGHGRVAMRGWRSILATLVHYRYITVTEAENTFAIHRGKESERWWTLTK